MPANQFFKYGLIVNTCTFALHFQVKVGTDDTGFIDIFTDNEYKLSLVGFCVPLPDQLPDVYTLKIGFTTQTSVGSVYFDSYDINDQKCPRKCFHKRL